MTKTSGTQPDNEEEYDAMMANLASASLPSGTPEPSGFCQMKGHEHAYAHAQNGECIDWTPRSFRDLAASTMSPEALARVDAATARLIALASPPSPTPELCDKLDGNPMAADPCEAVRPCPRHDPPSPTTPAPRCTCPDFQSFGECKHLYAGGTSLPSPEALARVDAATARVVDLAAPSRPAAPQGGEPLRAAYLAAVDALQVSREDGWVEAGWKALTSALASPPAGAPAPDVAKQFEGEGTWLRLFVREHDHDFQDGYRRHLYESDRSHIRALSERLDAFVAASRGAPETAPLTAEALAEEFHETYERLAPSHSYRTRPASAKPWAEVPENNRALMIAVCGELLTRRRLAARPAEAPGGETLTEADAQAIRDETDNEWPTEHRVYRRLMAIADKISASVRARGAGAEP